MSLEANWHLKLRRRMRPFAQTYLHTSRMNCCCLFFHMAGDMTPMVPTTLCASAFLCKHGGCLLFLSFRKLLPLSIQLDDFVPNARIIRDFRGCYQIFPRRIPFSQKRFRTSPSISTFDITPIQGIQHIFTVSNSSTPNTSQRKQSQYLLTDNIAPSNSLDPS